MTTAPEHQARAHLRGLLEARRFPGIQYIVLDQNRTADGKQIAMTLGWHKASPGGPIQNLSDAIDAYFVG